MQRELFALEVRRLQRCVFHLRNLYKKVSDNNKEATRLKEEIKELTAKIPELETSISVSFTHKLYELLLIINALLSSLYACTFLVLVP